MEVLNNILWRSILAVTLLLSVSLSAQRAKNVRIETVNDGYELLDRFLERPSAEAARVYKNQLVFWKPQFEEGQLAKVIGLCNLGHFEAKFFQFSEAISSYEKARQLFPKGATNRYDIIEFCLKPLGTLYTQTNALQEAESLILEYILLAHQDQQIHHEVAGLKNLSVVYQNKGRFQSAISVLQQGLKLAPNEEGLLLNLATNYRSVGELAKAEEIVIQLVTSDRLKAKAYQLRASIELERGQNQMATQSLQDALSVLKTGNKGSRRELAKLNLAMAQLETVLKNSTKALAHIQNVYELLVPNYNKERITPSETQLFPENTLMDALDLHAYLLGNEDNMQQALHLYDLAFKVSDLLDDPSTLQESKLLQQTNWKKRSERCIELLYEMYEKDASVKWFEKALQVDALSKSRIVKKEQEWRDQLLQQDSSEVAISLRETQRKIAQIGAEIKAITHVEVEETEPLLKLQTRYNALILEQRELSHRFQKQYGKGPMRFKVSLNELLSRVKKQKETIVSYFVGSDGIYQWVISNSEFTFERITKNQKEINDIMQYYADMILYFESSKKIASDPLSFARASNRLYESLQIPKTERLVVIPDGMFAYVPFGALTTAPTEAIDFQEMPFLVYDTEVSYSLSLADYLDSSEEVRATPTVLGVFPVFRNTPRSLVYSINEADGISDVVSTQLLMEEEATSVEFLSQQQTYNTLHISTHARGGTFTAPAAIEFKDRLLTVNELYGYNFRKDLVVLSACETGVGKVVKGEGALSVARAFQYAGAKNTLFSLWKVNDLSTAQLMTEFYQSLSQNGSYKSALHQSKLSYLMDSKIDNTKKSPYYWAAFVYYGDTQLNDTPFNWMPIYMLLVTVLVFFVIKAIYRKKKVQRNT